MASIKDLNTPQGIMVDKDGSPTPPWYRWTTIAGNVLTALTTSGTTAQRPASFLWIGRPYFDITLGIPIWYDQNGSTGWCDATGTAA